MKIKQAEVRINASYNTIKKFIEKKSEYNEIVEGVIHVTEKGLEELEKKYGVKSEILNDENIFFYKNQISFIGQQLKETQKYNEYFLKQIEAKSIESNIKNEEITQKNMKILELEEKINQQSLIELELKHELELEKNKSILQKIFKK